MILTIIYGIYKRKDFAMKTTTKLCTIAVCSLVFLCSCNAPNNGTSENYAAATTEITDIANTENEYVGYTFEYPKSWNVIRNDGMICVQSNEDNPDNRVTISCTTFDSNDPMLTVLAYWDGDGTEENPGYYNRMKKTLGGSFTEISRKETKLGNTGAPALKVTYEAEVADRTYRFSQVISVMQGSVYTFTYTALPETFEVWESALTHAVTSFSMK